LRARRAKQARAEREERLAEVARAAPPRQKIQLALPSADGWFAAHGWQPFDFQRELWRAISSEQSGLLHATTGSGKTYAVWFGLLNRALAGEIRGGGLGMLWLTPMRALAADTARALRPRSPTSASTGRLPFEPATPIRLSERARRSRCRRCW
jgi:ATP-dependent Lhr-like helicase